MTTSIMGSGKECSQAWELMPWVLQDSATEEQSERLLGHLARCESCSAEFAQQSRLRLAMSLPADVHVDAEAGLQHLLDRLDAPEPRMSAHARSGNWLTWALAAAVLVQAIGIGALGTRLSTLGASATYRTLSDPVPAAAPGAIRVVPDAHMSLADWDALLHTLHLKVVGGPNEVGAYTVAPDGDAASAQSQRALQQLRATRGIRLAEPVATP